MRTTTATANVSAIPSLNPISNQNPNLNPDAELNEAADHLTSAISHMVSDLNAGKSLDSNPSNQSLTLPKLQLQLHLHLLLLFLAPVFPELLVNGDLHCTST